MNFFVFIHIEKASGSTLHNWLKYNIPMYVSLRSWHKWTNEKAAEFNIRDLKFLRMLYPMCQGIGGHTTRPYLEYEKAFLLNKNIKRFTFIREPIARYLSHYQYQRDQLNIPWSLDSFCMEPRFRNFTVKRIAGEENLQKAIDITNDKLDFVGITEKFDGSIALLNEIIFNGRFSTQYERRNEGRLTTKILPNNLSSSVRTKVTENNNLDVEFYQYVLKDIFPRYEEKFPALISQSQKTSSGVSNENFQYNHLRVKTIKYWKGYNHFCVEPIVRKIFHKQN